MSDTLEVQNKVIKEFHEKFSFQRIPFISFFKLPEMKDPLQDRWFHVLAKTPFPPHYSDVLQNDILNFYNKVLDEELCLKDFDILFLDPSMAQTQHISRLVEYVLRDNAKQLLLPFGEYKVNGQGTCFEINRQKLISKTCLYRMALSKILIIHTLDAIEHVVATANKLAQWSSTIFNSHPHDTTSFYSFTTSSSSEDEKSKRPINILIPHDGSENEVLSNIMLITSLVSAKTPEIALSNERIQEIGQTCNLFFKQLNECSEAFSTFLSTFKVCINLDISIPKSGSAPTSCREGNNDEYRNLFLSYKRIFTEQRDCFQNLSTRIGRQTGSSLVNPLSMLSISSQK